MFYRPLLFYIISSTITNYSTFTCHSPGEHDNTDVKVQMTQRVMINYKPLWIMTIDILTKLLTSIKCIYND